MNENFIYNRKNKVFYMKCKEICSHLKQNIHYIYPLEKTKCIT